MGTRLSLLAASALIIAAPAPACTQEPKGSPISEAELIRRLTKSLDSLVALDQFAGVVVIARNGTPVFERAHGMADRESAIPNTVETAFNLGSINKVFTATAIRQLAETGKLDLDSTLARYWPDYPNQEVARKMTIRQLLQHRSGVGGDIFAAPAGGKRSDLRHNREFLPLFVMEPLEFEPGSRSEYSNAGYAILGMLVERISGEDYYSYVRRHIYEPAGMTRTMHLAVDSLPPKTARGYTRGEEDAPTTAPLQRNTETLPGRGSAAGGGYSTAQDLLRFLQALRERRIPGGPPAGLGVGGGAPGLNAAVEGALPGGYDVIVLANLDPPAAQRIAKLVRSWLSVDN